MNRDPTEEAAAVMEKSGQFLRRVRSARERARPGSREHRLLTTWAEILEDIRHQVLPLLQTWRSGSDKEGDLRRLLDDWRHVEPWMP